MSLAALLVRRLTHDFAGPVGAIGTAVEMDASGDLELMALIADGAAGLAATLKLYRFIATPDAGMVASGMACGLVAEWLATRDAPVLDWPDDGDWPAAIARLTAGLAMVAAATRARRLTVARGAVRLDIEIDAAVAAVLGGTPPTSTGDALAGLLAELAAEAGLILNVLGRELSVHHASASPR